MLENDRSKNLERMIIQSRPVQCDECGCAIRYGRFCPECMKELTGGLRAAFHEDVGERPKGHPRITGQYHFLKKK